MVTVESVVSRLAKMFGIEQPRICRWEGSRHRRFDVALLIFYISASHLKCCNLVDV